MYKLVEYKTTSYPGKHNNSKPVIECNITGETLIVCKKCKCCYSPGGQFCEVSYVSNGNKLFSLDRSIPQMVNGFLFPAITYDK